MVATYELPVSVEKEKGGFFASCSVWPECYAQGDTLEEALSEINSVALGLIELYNEEGLPVPLTKKGPPETLSKSTRFVLPLYVTN